MSSEEEIFQEDKEYQNTQKEIEDLRKREEELMVKINALEKKQKSVSDNSFDEKENEKEDTVSDHDIEENEGLGKRRRPSLSRGSAKNSESLNYRPKSLELENQAGTFRSRSSRSPSTSPTKENRSSVSASKERVYSSRSTISIKQSSSPVTSETKSSMGKGYRMEVSTSGASSPSKEDKPIASSKSKMIRSYSATSPEKSPRMSIDSLSKSSNNSKILNRRSFPAVEDSSGDTEMQNETTFHSTTSLSKVKIPENKLSNREARGSRDSSRDEKLRGSIKLNEDSYEIIEIDDEQIDLSSNEDKATLSARAKIEKELIEQNQREEELRIAQRLSNSSKKEEEEMDDKEDLGNSNESTDDEEYDDKAGQESGQESDEKQTLSTWEKIALEIEEEKRREDEIRNKTEGADENSTEDENGSVSDNEMTTDVTERITQEIEEQKRREKEIRKMPSEEEEGSSEEESNESEKGIGLSVQDRIELEIKEIEKRENELKKIHKLEEPEEIAEEEEEFKSPRMETGTKTKIQQEIDDFKKKESEFRKLHGVDDRNASDDEDNDSNRSSSMSIIERELVEQRRKEREFRRQHKQDLQLRNEGKVEDEDSYDDDEIPEDESMLIERNKRKNKGQAGVGNKFEANEKSEFIVAPGITRKFIHLFDKGSEKFESKKLQSREPITIKNRQLDEKPKMNGQNHANKEVSEGELEDVENVSFEEEDEIKQDKENELTSVENNKENKEEQTLARQHGIDAPAPGKKLVLKRKKSKDRKQEQNYNERNEKSTIPMKGSSALGSKVRNLN